MIQETALILISCVLFIQMGLSQAIQDFLKVRLRFLSCPKCLTFWVTLITLLTYGNTVIESVAVSFIAAYLALWLSLLYDCMATIYNKCYDHLSKTQDTESDSLSESSQDAVS